MDSPFQISRISQRSLADASIRFTTVDLASGFHYIEMREWDIQKAVVKICECPLDVKTPLPHFKGLQVSSKGRQESICLKHMDDVVVSQQLHSKTCELSEVIQRFPESNLIIK